MMAGVKSKEIPPSRLDHALEGVMSLLNPGPYGVADDDPKAALIRDLTDLVSPMKVKPVVIGGIAVNVHGHHRQTADVDLLVSRDEALALIRRLEASRTFSKVRIDRFKHLVSGAGLDLCVEGERPSPYHRDRFPSPASVEQVTRDPLPVVGLSDLLALKVKSGRARDLADFVDLFVARRLAADDIERVRAKIEDEKLRVLLDEWHAKAREEIERERLRRPPDLE
jgi:hypothetical protein